MGLAPGSLAQSDIQWEVTYPPNAGASPFGCAWGDYDGDGYVDLAVANGFDHNELIGICRNNRDGTFTLMTPNEVGVVAEEQRPWVLVRWADMNGDGKLDLLASDSTDETRLGKNRLYLNNGQNVFSPALTSDLNSVDSVAGWVLPVDYDRDGILDLLAGHNWGTSLGQLLRGRGDGTLSLIGNLPSVSFDGNSAVWADYDGDGDPDLFVPNVGSRPDGVYRNDGGGKFTRITAGLLANSSAASANPAWGDYDNDGDLDLALSKMSGPAIILRNDGTNFSKGPTLPPIDTSSSMSWLDYDNDGWLDLYYNPALLFHNNGDGTFTQDPNAPRADAGPTTYADINNDGFMDLYSAASGGNPLFRNLTNANHWIKFKLVGTVSNRDALGAKVRVRATIRGQSIWQMREISSGAYQQDDPRPNFGLGDAASAELVRIEWPSGLVQELQNIPAGQILTVVEPVLRVQVELAGSQVQLRLTTDPGAVYAIEGTANLASWSLATEGTNVTGTVTWPVPAGSAPHQFYRVFLR